AYYERYLSESSEAAKAREYLKARGLGEEVLREFGVGYAPSAWDRVLMASRRGGFANRELYDVGLVQRSRGNGMLYDRFRSRIMFPLFDSRGHVLGFGARAMREQQRPKYLNTSDNELYHKGRHLYGAHLARVHAARAGTVAAGEVDSPEGRDRVIEELRPVFATLAPSAMRMELTRLVSGRLALSEGLAESLLSAGGGSATAGVRTSGAARVAAEGGGQGESGERAGKEIAAASALGRREHTERAFLALCIASPEEGARALAELELASLDRQIMRARGQESGDVSALAERRAAVRGEFDRAYGRVLERTGDKEGAAAEA